MKLILALILGLITALPVEAARTPLTANTTFYLAAPTATPPGIDAPGCGAVTSPCATFNGAFANALYQIDGMGFTITISDPTCADPNGFSAEAAPMVGVAWPVYLAGNPSSPCPTGSLNFYGGWWSLWNFQISCSAASCNAITYGGGARVDIGNIDFGAVNLAHTFGEGTGSSLNYLAPVTVSGAAEEHDHVIWGATVSSSVAVTCPPPAAVIVDYWLGNGGGYADYTGSTFSGCTNVGYQFEVHLGGVMRSPGSLLPGNQVGVYAGGNVQDNIGTALLALYGSDGVGTLSGSVGNQTIYRPPTGPGIFCVEAAVAGCAPPF